MVLWENDNIMQMQLKYRFVMSGFYRGATITPVYRPALEEITEENSFSGQLQVMIAVIEKIWALYLMLALDWLPWVF